METCEPASLNTSGAVRYTGISVTQVCYTGVLHRYQRLQMDPRDALLYAHRAVHIGGCSK